VTRPSAVSAFVPEALAVRAPGVDEAPDRLVLPVWAFGDELIAGPVNWGGAGSRGPRWADAVQSLTTHDTDSAGSLFWSRAWAGMPTGREATWVPAVERMIAVIAAFEVFKAVTGAMEPETGESILVLDCRTGETRRHRVLPNRLLRTAPRHPGAGASAAVDRARPRSSSTGVASATGWPSSVARSGPWRPRGRSSAARVVVAPSPRWRSPGTPTPASPPS